jgi:hypothetical protein
MARVIWLVLLLASCSPQKRLARLLDKHPNLTDSVWTEIVLNKTITEIDTFTLPGDTVSVPYEVLKRDTVFKVGRVTLSSSGGKISAYTKPDTFIQRDTIRFKEVVRLPTKVIVRPWKLWQSIVFWLPIFLLGFILYKRAQLLRRKRPLH